MLFPWTILPGQQNLEGMQNWSNLLLNLILMSFSTQNESHVIADWIWRKEVGKQLYLHTHSLHWSDSCQELCQDCHLCPRSSHVLQHPSAGQQEQQGEQGGCNPHSKSHSTAGGNRAAEPEMAVSSCTGKVGRRDAFTELSEHRHRADEHFQPLHSCFPLLSLFKTRDSLCRAGIRVISRCIRALCTLSLAYQEYLRHGTVHFIKCQFSVFFPLNAPFTCYHGGDRWPFVVVYSLENEVFE